MTQSDQQTRILLVDDNDMAREMIRALLENAGIDVVEADNGLDAIDKVAAEEFDLVLMDVQMPVLDGRSAAREIRNLDCAYSKTLPIIAMTANSFSEFRVESLAAGMNAHIGKPVDLRVLYTELQRWLPAGKHHQLDALVSPKETDIATLTKMLPRVDVKTGIHRVAGDQTLYLNLLHRFIGRFSTLEVDLAAIIERGEKGEAVRYAHTLKGVAGGLGATALQMVVGRLEAQFSQSEIPSMITAVVEELIPLLADMETALELRDQTAGDEAKPLGYNEELMTLLDQLKEPLLTLQVQQVRQLLSQIKSTEWPQKHDKNLVELETLIEQFQFVPAASLIDTF